MIVEFIITLSISTSPIEVRNKWLPVVELASKHYDLDSKMLDALIWEESNWNPLAVSHAGAEGLTQLMPPTAEMLKVNNSFEPGQAIWGAAWYLRMLHNKFDNWELTLAAYNAGPHRVRKCQCVPFSETKVYIKRIMNRWQ